MRAIDATAPGGPDVLRLVERPDPEPGPTDVLVRVAAAGVNFVDTYRRSGLYPASFPHTVGSEGAGRVVAIGAEVSDIAVGDRVAWASAPGSYAELVLVPAAIALPVPDAVDDQVAAAIPMQGLTAHYLAASTFPVTPGQDVLVHAGAGGVGLLLTQLAAARGARVITTVGAPAKEALSREAGATDVIRYTELDDLTAELPTLVRDLTGGAGVHTVFDGVGRATFEASLASLRPRGGLALFGAASGPAPPIDPQRLNAAGSLYLTRPTLGHYTATREELLWRAGELFAAIAAGLLDVRIGAAYPLAEAADAHRALEGRATTGKVLLLP
ncbi:quinone oxidoreductase family protein [Cellulomonas chengniuliangii]|uniref:Quinone oxidoreductase n=1 Tax=Cellulomonas chengniuliangii TaxID=2968084 RepID=A0ABY5L8P8_9CELL|nr:quinone oxidoreductase [Cellulomonas chengniuliangii]MCC2310186.1 quinone oxidoreductase [Cellulomonas chengniuliangii]UUI76973.1 quinone oxidoreductase [Cellulomonas chengniuliangii]